MNSWGEVCNSNDGNLIWFGMAIREQNLPLIRKRPKVLFNRYPGFECLARKKELSMILSRMSKYFPLDFQYVPQEFLVPEELNALKTAVEENSKRWWIAKPSKGCGGDGIFLS